MEMEQFHFRKSLIEGAEKSVVQEEKKFMGHEQEEKKGPGRITLMAGYKKERGTWNPEDGEAHIQEEGEEDGEGDEGEVEGGSELLSPSLALIAVGSGSSAAATLSAHRIAKDTEAQLASSKSRVLVLNRFAASRRAAHAELIRKGGLNREQASRKLQGSCRIWLARRDLASRAEVHWILVRPDSKVGACESPSDDLRRLFSNARIIPARLVSLVVA